MDEGTFSNDLAQRLNISFQSYPLRQSTLLTVAELLAGFMLFWLILWPPTSHSQGISTNITSDGSLGTVVTSGGTIHDITGGTRPSDGPNLFHSFSQLHVGNGDVANFLNDSGLPTENILSRVTGGDPTQIYGTLQTTNFGNANLFLLNPAGVVFGPTASLNVGGSVHVSTADYFQFKDRGVLFANLSKESVLTTAPVEAFGFLNENPASLTLERSYLAVPDGETLSLIGGDITATGNPGEDIPTLQAIEGRINLVSVDSPGKVNLNETTQPLSNSVNSFSTLGDISLSNDTIFLLEDFATTRAGTVVIRGGRLVMDNATILNQTYGTQNAAGPISIETSDEVVLRGNTSILTSTFGDGNGSPLGIQAPTIDIGDNVLFQAGTGGLGRGGSIVIKGDDIHFSGDTLITSPTIGPGHAGEVFVEAQSITFSDDASIQTPTFSDGDAGAVTIQATDLTLRDTGRIQSSSEDAFTPNPAGNGAPITLTVETLTMRDQALLESGNKGTGNAGGIIINATDVDLAGNIFIEAGTLGAGSGGPLRINAKQVSIADHASVGSATNGPGDAGVVTIHADTLSVTTHATIGSVAFEESSGTGGEVNLMVNDTIRLNNGGSITAQNLSSSHAGKISINSGTLEIENGQILNSATQGMGGSITITTDDNIRLTQTSLISAQTNGPANAGNINLEARNSISLQDSTIRTSAEEADGGNIKLTASDTIQLTESLITSTVNGGSSTQGGNINLDPEFIILNSSDILAQAGVGQGGKIQLTGNVILIDPASTVNASAGPAGIDGSVSVNAPIQNLSGSIAPLPDDFIEVTQLYSAHCAAQKGGNLSSFVYQQIPSLPIQPGGFMNSQIAWGGPAMIPHFSKQERGSDKHRMTRHSRIFDVDPDQTLSLAASSLMEHC